MAETPEELWERVQREGLRTPPVESWHTWPFAGPVVPRELTPPVEAEEPRFGAGGGDCLACERGVEDTLWHDDDWMLRTSREPTGLPFVCILQTRRHVDFPDLDDDLAVKLGPMLLKVQRAIFKIPHIGNVHVCRWGDGSEHFHIWFMARPARIPQLIGSFAAIWDDIVPPLPQHVWDANAVIVRTALAA